MWKRSLPKIKRYRAPNWSYIQEQIPIEREWELYIDGQLETQSLITPRQQAEWAYGYALSQQKIPFSSPIPHDKQENQIHLSTQDISPKTQNSKPLSDSISAAQVLSWMADFQDKAVLYKDTAIVESIAFANKQGIAHFADDVNPLNAWYKLLGSAYLAKTHPQEYALIVFGKLTRSFLELVHAFNVRVVISRTGLTDQTFDFAQAQEITLLGFTRGNQFTLFNNPQLLIKAIK